MFHCSTRRSFGKAALALALSALPFGALAQPTTIQVFYGFPNNYKAVLDQIATEFHAQNPDVKVEFWAPASSYDTATPQVLRGALTNQLPDVFFTGLNYLRILQERDLLVPLDALVGDPEEWERLGYRREMLAMGRLGDRVYALPFAISMPVLYVNENLVKRAGGSVETLPRDWRELAAFGQKVAAVEPGVTGFFFAYDGSGNYSLQSLINSFGGRMGSDDGCRIALQEPEWRQAFELLEAFHKSGMPAFTQDQIRQAFAAGKVGIYVGSTSQVARMEQASVGRFSFRTVPYPRASETARLPAGGSIAVMMAKDAKRQEAAFRFMKFATGPVGQTRVATFTGYMPGNRKALEDPNLLGTFYEKNPNSGVGIEQLPFIGGWHNWAGANSVKIVDVIQEHTTAVAAGRQSGEAALASLTRQVQPLLATCGS